MPKFGALGYLGLLDDLIAAGYKLLPVEQLARSGRNVFMRHDVDVHLDGLLDFASAERERDCRATYFIPVTFHFNPLYEPNRHIIRAISGMGHRIGLHYDPIVTRTPDELARQVAILSDVADREVVSVTSHKPGSIESVVDTSGYFVPKHDEYVSDSGRRWRDDRLLALVEAGSPFLLLTHLEHWLSDQADLLEHFAQATHPTVTAAANRHVATTLRDAIDHR